MLHGLWPTISKIVKKHYFLNNLFNSTQVKRLHMLNTNLTHIYHKIRHIKRAHMLNIIINHMLNICLITYMLTYAEHMFDAYLT